MANFEENYEVIEEVIDEETTSDFEVIDEEECTSENGNGELMATVLTTGAVLLSTALTGFVMGVRSSDKVKSVGNKIRTAYEEGRQKAIEKRKARKAKRDAKKNDANTEQSNKAEGTSEEKSKE